MIVQCGSLERRLSACFQQIPDLALSFPSASLSCFVAAVYVNANGQKHECGIVHTYMRTLSNFEKPVEMSCEKPT
jgi:hypothetical protein